MITAVDTNVLLDVFSADPRFGEQSREALRRCAAQGRLVACEAVWAELAGAFRSSTRAQEDMERLGVSFSALDEQTALSAGVAWIAYRRAGGLRTRILADFLIGAHAHAQAERLVTRDRGFFRKHFHDLPVLDPTAVP